MSETIVTPPGQIQHEDPVQTHLYRIIERILDIGFFIGIGIILLGTILTFAKGDDLPDDVVSLNNLPGEVADLEPTALIDLGLVLLLLTPLSYVVAALITFLRQRDRMFIGVCLLLIALIGLSVGLAVF
jgi:uncharacterized membrane protein